MREALKLEFDALFAEHQKLLGELQAMKALAQPEQERCEYCKRGLKTMCLCGMKAQPEHKKCENCGEFGECCQEQPEQEPCRHRIVDIRNEAVKSGYMCMDCGALFGAYTTPPQRTWVGMPDDEKEKFVVAYYPSNWDRKTAVALMNNYEAYLKEKNT